LKKFRGTVVAISHDRHFLRGFAGTIWRVGGGRVKVYPGDYAYYEWKHRQESEQERENSINEAIEERPDTSASTNGNRSVSGPKTKEQKRREAEIRNRLSQETRGVKKSIVRCEKEIEKSEFRKAEIEKKMMDPEFHQSAEAGPVMKEYSILQHRIDELMDEWGELTEKLESAEARVIEELDM
jgi:ATP-binding cassette subfamily F protein 3